MSLSWAQLGVSWAYYIEIEWTLDIYGYSRHGGQAAVNWSAKYGVSIPVRWHTLFWFFLESKIYNIVPISSPRKYTEHTTESYTKFQALVQAIRNCSELIENKDKTEISRALQDIVSPSDRSRIIQ